MDQQNFAQMFWKHVLVNIKLRDNSPIADPVKRLRELIGQGLFKGLPTWKVDSIIQSVGGIAPLWKNSDSVSAMAVLVNVLECNKASDVEISRLADCLAEYAKTFDMASFYTDPSDSVFDSHDLPLPDMVDANELDTDDDRTAKPVHIVWTPKMIFNLLGQHVLGQNDAKQAASLIMYNTLHGRRTNAVFCGPSGCGKTEIWRRLQRAFPDMIRIFDGSRLAADGWRGSIHLRDFFNGLTPEDISRNGLIIAIDEADKMLCEPAFGSNGTNYSAIVQSNLLKMLDGDVIEFGADDGEGHKKPLKVDCAHVSVVLLGAFERLMNQKNVKNRACMGFGAEANRAEQDYSNSTITHEDLIDAGMRREIAGRINRIVRLQPLGIDDYKAILVGPMLDDLQASIGAHIEIPDATVDELAKQAIDKKLGARWMRSQVSSAVDDIMFDNPTTAVYRIDNLPMEEGEMQ